MARAEEGHALLIQPPELIDLAGLDEFDRFEDFGRGDAIGRSTLVGWSPCRWPPLFAKGVGRLGGLRMSRVMLGHEPSGRQASGHTRYHSVVEKISSAHSWG
jgi:hypothetical protein